MDKNKKDQKEYGAIRIRLKSKELFESIAEKHSIRHIDLFDQMTQHFNETLLFKNLTSNTNPIDLDENLRKMKNQLIGVIKNQEQDFLFPILRKIQFVEKLLSESLMENSNFLNKENKNHLPPSFEEEKENQKNEIKELFLDFLAKIKHKKSLMGGHYYEVEAMGEQDFLRLKELVESL